MSANRDGFYPVSLRKLNHLKKNAVSFRTLFHPRILPALGIHPASPV
jgi:hypothetical protein